MNTSKSTRREKLHSLWRWTWKAVKAKFICLRWGGEMSWLAHGSGWRLLHKMLDLLGGAWEQISFRRLSVHWRILDQLGRSVGVGVQVVFGVEYHLGFVVQGKWSVTDILLTSGVLPVRRNSNTVFQAAEILQSHIRKRDWFYSLSQVCYSTIIHFHEKRSQGSKPSHLVL